MSQTPGPLCATCRTPCENLGTDPILKTARWKCPRCGRFPTREEVADARIARQYRPEATPLLPGLEPKR